MKFEFDHIRELVVQMQADQGPAIARMREILRRYDGEWVLPLPDLKNEPKIPQLTPALIGEAIDQLALRAASITPSLHSPPLDHTKAKGKRSREYAQTRANAIRATEAESRWTLGARRYYRHLTAYHTASIVVRPDMHRMLPIREVRDPLASFVEPKAAESLADPCYACFVTRMSGKALRYRFPKVMAENGGPITHRDVHKLWEVVEWYDEDDCVWGLLGTVDAAWGEHVMHLGAFAGGQVWMELERLPNRAGMLPVVQPHNVSLGRIVSRIGQLIGNVDLQAKLAALQITAQEKAIFPDVYALGMQGEEPSLDGDWKDGRTGDINLVSGVQQIGVLRTTPDPNTGQMIDRLERNFRVSTTSLPQFGGETYGALRTGRGIDALAGMALDPRIQELHEITEAYLPKVHEAELATYKGYWGAKKYSLYTRKGNQQRLVEFTPNEHFENNIVSCSYFVAGLDYLQLTQVLGSLLGTKTMSQRSFQQAHPMIGDADAEAALIREEELEQAAMAGLVQQVMSGALSPVVLTMVRDEIAKGNDVLTAMANVDQALRRMQATQAPEPQAPMALPPEAMPGITGGPTADQQPMAPPQQIQPFGEVGRMRELVSQMGGG